MKQFLFIILLLNSLVSIAQDTRVVADPNARPREITGSFTAVSVGSGIELYLSQSNDISLAVSVSEEKYLERFKTEVVDGVLRIYYDHKGIGWASSDNKRKLKAYLSVKTLEKLSGSGGSRVITSNAFTAGDFKMKFSSGSFFNGQVKATSLNVDMDSGAQVQISGSATNTSIDVSSGAMFKGYDFTTASCNAEATSGGAIRITINSELSARANSGGAVHYKGDPVVKSLNVNSGGIIKKS